MGLEGYSFACKLSDLPPRGKKLVRFGQTRVLIIACESGLYAVEDRCPQTARSIAHGEVLNCILTTPTNGARYDLRTGQYVGGGLSPFQSHWPTIFPVIVVNDEVYVRLPEAA